MATTLPRIYEAAFDTPRLASQDRFLQTAGSVVHHDPPPSLEPERTFPLCQLPLQ